MRPPFFPLPFSAKWLVTTAVLFLLAFLSFPWGVDVLAEPPEKPATDPATPGSQAEPPSPDDSMMDALRNLMKSRREAERELSEKSRRMKAPDASPEEKTSLKAEMDHLSANERGLSKNFEKIATGLEPDHLREQEPRTIRWEEEITRLVTPLFAELRQLTERPRKIEALRNEVMFSEQRRNEAVTGIKNLESLMTRLDPGDEDLRKELQRLRKEWKARGERIDNQLTVQRYQLEDLLRQRKSLLTSAQESMRAFFKTRGRNLMFSGLAFIGVFLLLRFCHQAIHRYSPLRRKIHRTLPIRLLDVLYHLFTFMGAVGVALVVLYLSGDWLLLSLVIIFLLGLAWTAKEGLPRFWRQVQLMLNLGTVREGERIIYSGVPWRVVSLAMTGILENPCFQPSRIRVPLRDLVSLVSRPWDTSEPWFPAGIGEWVTLADGAYGQIVSAGPEMVRLKLGGGAMKTYTTADFLGETPVNLSADFRIEVVFGFDYADQGIVTTVIPEALTAHLRQGLVDEGHEETLKRLRVDVESAAASSLDLVVVADFAGTAAPFHKILRRTIQRLCIELCTAKGWNIPFTQMVVHMAPAANAS